MSKTVLGLFPLVMLITGAVDGIANLPSIAYFGPRLVFFFMLASLLFLLPVGLVSSELCAQLKEKGGVFDWGAEAFSKKYGFILSWLQWINTMLWFPTTLSTLVGTTAYLVSPTLSHSPVYLVLASLIVIWTMTLLNLKGIQQSAFFASLGTSLGLMLPFSLIIGLSLFWIYTGRPLAFTLTFENFLPDFSHAGAWASLTAVITAFLGMELAAVHVKQVEQAEKLFSKALLISIVIIIMTMGLGALCIAMVVPHERIVLVTGTIQAFDSLFYGFGLSSLKPVLGVLLVLGSLGAMINWLISPAKGLANAFASLGILPKLTTLTENGVPVKIMLLQALVISCMLSIFFLIPSVNGSYWYLLDLSTELYVLMYLLMFIAAFKLFLRLSEFKVIPGGKLGALLTVILGMLGGLTAFVVGFFPPEAIDVGGDGQYAFIFLFGLLLMVLPALLLIAFANIRKNAS